MAFTPTIQAQTSKSPPVGLKRISAKRHVLMLTCCLLLGATQCLLAQNMSINNDGSQPDPSAMLDVSDTAGGFLMPRLTQTQRMLIASPANGLMVFQTDGSPGLYIFDGVGNNWEHVLDSTAVAALITASSGNLASVLSNGSDAGGDSIVNVGRVTIGAAVATEPTAAMEIHNTGGSPLRVYRHETGVWKDASRSFNDSIDDNATFAHVIGKESSEYNSAWIGYKHLGDDSSGNALVLSLWDHPDILSVTGEERVGIGTTSPSAKLEITDDSSTPLIINRNLSSSYVQAFRLRNNAMTSGNTFNMVFGKEETNKNAAWIGFRYINENSDSNAMNFGLWQTNNILVINGQRRVGVNTTTPSAALDVEGKGEFDTLSVEGAFTFPLADGADGQVLQTDGNGNLTWETAVAGDSAWTFGSEKIYQSTRAVYVGDTVIPSSFYGLGGLVNILNTDSAISLGVNAGGGDNAANISISGVFTNTNTGTGSGLFKYGLYSSSEGGNGSGENIGVNGNAQGGSTNKAGFFSAESGLGTTNIGVSSVAQHNDNNIAIYAYSQSLNTSDSNVAVYAEVSGNTSIKYAGIFKGGQVRIEDTLQVLGAIKMGNEFIFPSTDGTSGQVMQTNGSGIITWVAPPTGSLIEDTDQNTKIQTEESLNEDIIRLDIGGTEYIRFESLGRMNITNSNSGVYIGSEAGKLISTGTGNTFLGFEAGSNTSSSGSSTYIGYQAGKVANATGNTVIGSNAGDAINTGTYNTMLGLQAGSATNSGAENVFLGKNAGRINDSGDQNTFVGTAAGDANIGDRNVFLGFEAGSAETTASDRLYIENSNSTTPLIWGDFANDSVKIFGILQVDANVSGDAELILVADVDNNNNNDNPSIQFLQDGSQTRGLIGLHGTDNQLFPNTAGNSMLIGMMSDEDVTFFTDSIPRMTIEGSGSVGIGTTEPEYDLHIVDETGNGSMQLESKDAGSDAYINFVTTESDFQLINYGADSKFYIYSSNSGTDALVVDTLGRVGINMTSPTAAFEVNGRAIADTLEVDGKYTFPYADGTADQVMQTDGNGNVTWETLNSTSGAGQTDFLTKWSSASTLDTSLIQDNGTTVSIGTAPSSSGLLHASTSDNTISAAIRAEHNLNSSTTTYGVVGYSASTDGNNAAGVYGRADNGAYAVYGQQQSSDAGTVAINGYNPAGGSNANYGVKGQTSSSNPSSAGLYGFAFHGGNALLVQSNARVIEASASGARTSSFSAIELNNSATSSTSSISKTGLDIQSTGTWSGTGATNIGLNVNVGNGTTNYAALFNGGNVGIGTSSPNASLHILNSTSTVRQTLESTSGDDAEISLTSGANEWLIDFDANQNASTNKSLLFSYNTNKFLTIQGTTGNVGIGTSTPSELLEVNGRALIDTLEINGIFTFPSIDGSNGQVITTNGNGVLSWDDPSDDDWTVSGGIVYNTSDRFAVGTSALPASYFSEIETPSGSTYAIGLSIDHNYTGSAQQFGLATDLANTSSGEKYAIYNTVTGNTSQASAITGTYNKMTSANTEQTTGVYNSLSINGTGVSYGVNNALTVVASNTSDQYGMSSSVLNQGSGVTYGEYVTIYGIGSGPRFGAFFNVSANSSTTDSTIGVWQRMNVDGSGNAYGSYIDYSQASGTGSHYGIYSEGEDRNYFSGKLGIGTSNPAYSFSVQTATSNYGIEHTDGSISFASYIDTDAAWIGTVSSHPLYLYTDDGNSELAISTSGDVSIGNNHTTATSKLDVEGDIETSGEFYFGDPTTNGSWRIIRDGNDLVFQRREGGTWIDKTAITP